MAKTNKKQEPVAQEAVQEVSRDFLIMINCHGERMFHTGLNSHREMSRDINDAALLNRQEADVLIEQYRRRLPYMQFFLMNRSTFGI